jgi:hypothetical protein
VAGRGGSYKVLRFIYEQFCRDQLSRGIAVAVFRQYLVDSQDISKIAANFMSPAISALGYAILDFFFGIMLTRLAEREAAASDDEKMIFCVKRLRYLTRATGLVFILLVSYAVYRLWEEYELIG